MSDEPELGNYIAEVASRAEQFLQKTDPAPFSPAAFEVLKEKITDHVSDLIKESAATAKRDNADSISTKHVEAASEHLVTHSGGKLNQHLGTWGGMFLGTSLSSIGSMLFVQQYPVAAILFAIVAGVAGAFLLGLSLRR